MNTIIIGIDCAVDARNVAVATGQLRDERAVVTDAFQCGDARTAAQAVASIIGTKPDVLLALDAPLGWPAPLGLALLTHVAGDALQDDAHTLFRRTTDIEVKRMTGKQPLDVGADRIARTAHAALRLLTELRSRTNCPIPLAWSPNFRGVEAIEVYPAATLRQAGISNRPYKKREQLDARRAIVEQLGRCIDLSAALDTVLARADTLDAAVCVLAGADFLLNRAVPPADAFRRLAQREGWIWVRSR